MNVVIRADASVDIGIGHIMRCTTLAYALKQRGCRPIFVCRALPGDSIAWLEQAGFSVLVLTPSSSHVEADVAFPILAHAHWLPVTPEEDAEQTLAALQAFGLMQPQWVIVDHYALDKRWEARVRAATECQVFVIDDIADRVHQCDLLLDQNLNKSVDVYRAYITSSCRTLFGLDYALLRSEFSHCRARAVARRSSAQPIRRFLIAMGGMDKENVSVRVLDALSQMTSELTFDVQLVLGAQAPHLEAVTRSIKAYSFNIELSVGVENMAEVMCEADLAFGAAGTSSWERLALGLPTLLVVMADNQKPIADELDRSGVVVNLGLSTHLCTASIVTALRALLSDSGRYHAMVQRAFKLCDGRGCERVVEQICQVE